MLDNVKEFYDIIISGLWNYLFFRAVVMLIDQTELLIMAAMQLLIFYVWLHFLLIIIFLLNYKMQTILSLLFLMMILLIILQTLSLVLSTFDVNQGKIKMQKSQTGLALQTCSKQ